MAGLQITDQQVERYRKLLREKKYIDRYEDSWITGAFWTGLEKERFFKAVARRSRFRVDLIAIDVRTKTQTQCMEYINILDHESISRRNTVEQELCNEISDRFGAVEDVFQRFLTECQFIVGDELNVRINNLSSTATTDAAFRAAQNNRRYRMKKKLMSEEEIEENMVIDPHHSKELFVGQTLKKIVNQESIGRHTPAKAEEVLKQFLRPLIGLIIANVETRMAFMGAKDAVKNHMADAVTGDVDIALAMLRGTGPKEALDYEKRDHWLCVESQAPPLWNLEKWLPLSKTHLKQHELQAKMLDNYPFSTFQSDPLLPMNLPIMRKPHSYHKVYDDLLQELDDDADLEDHFEEYDREYEEALLKSLLEGMKAKTKRPRRESTSPVADVKRPRLDLATFDDDSEDDDDEARVLAGLKGVDVDGMKKDDINRDGRDESQNLEQGENNESEDEEEEDGEEEKEESQVGEPQEDDDNGEAVKREHDYDLEMYDEDEIVDSDLDSVEGLDFYAEDESPEVPRQGEEGRQGSHQSENENEEGHAQLQTNKSRLTSGFAINWIDYGV